MTKQILTLEKRIGWITDRYRGIPYEQVIENHQITPTQFAAAVSNIGTIISSVSASIKNVSKETKQDLIHDLEALADALQILRKIASDDKKKAELFRMGEDFIRRQCVYIKKERQQTLYPGTLMHPKNIDFVVYYALVSNNPALASTNRATVMSGINSLPTKLRDYFNGIGLEKLMQKHLEPDERGSPVLAVLKRFDGEYQRRTGDFSLFDLSQPEHLHEWDDKLNAPKSYWEDLENRAKAVYHILAEQNPALASLNRKEVIDAIKQLPENLRKYFDYLGFGEIRASAFGIKEMGYIATVLRAFDYFYQKPSDQTPMGRASLFDKREKPYLEFNQGKLVRQ